MDSSVSEEKKVVLGYKNYIAIAAGFIVWFCVGTFTCKDGHGYFLSWDRLTGSVDWKNAVADILLVVAFFIIFRMGVKDSGWGARDLGVYFLFCLGGGMIGSLVCVKNESWFTHSGSGGMRGWIKSF